MSDKVEKIIPSKLETGMQKVVYKTLGPLVPAKMTPNQMTLVGAIGCIIGVISSFLSVIHPLFLIGTLLGLLCHLVCDYLDGYIARNRNMTSMSGAFFDVLTDILHITFLLIGLTYSGYVSFQITIFLVPAYALIMFTIMNYILYLKEFRFPCVGPIEAHLFMMAVCVGIMIFGDNVICSPFGFSLRIADIICLIGGIPMYEEMIRLMIMLFVRLNKIDKQKWGEDNEKTEQ